MDLFLEYFRSDFSLNYDKTFLSSRGQSKSEYRWSVELFMKSLVFFHFFINSNRTSSSWLRYVYLNRLAHVVKFFSKLHHRLVRHRKIYSLTLCFYDRVDLIRVTWRGMLALLPQHYCTNLFQSITTWFIPTPKCHRRTETWTPFWKILAVTHAWCVWTLF